MDNDQALDTLIQAVIERDEQPTHATSGSRRGEAGGAAGVWSAGGRDSLDDTQLLRYIDGEVSDAEREHVQAALVSSVGLADHLLDLARVNARLDADVAIDIPPMPRLESRTHGGSQTVAAQSKGAARKHDRRGPRADEPQQGWSWILDLFSPDHFAPVGGALAVAAVLALTLVMPPPLQHDATLDITRTLRDQFVDATYVLRDGDVRGGSSREERPRAPSELRSSTDALSWTFSTGLGKSADAFVIAAPPLEIEGFRDIHLRVTTESGAVTVFGSVPRYAVIEAFGIFDAERLEVHQTEHGRARSIKLPSSVENGWFAACAYRENERWDGTLLAPRLEP